MSLLVFGRMAEDATVTTVPMQASFTTSSALKEAPSVPAFLGVVLPRESK